MSRDENQDVSQQASQANATAIQRSQGWFLTPKPIKVLFKKFPLQTLPANKLPLRTVPHRGRHTLWIFTTEEDAKTGVPSFNPACLKWQTYLRVCGLEFNTIPSCNHASPSGTLPFLIPPSSPLSSSSKASNPVPSNKLRKWLWEQELSKNEPESIEYEAYGSLLDYRIREAWLYHLYLIPENFISVAVPLYIDPTTRSQAVRKALAHQLHAAAQAELLKTSKIIDSEAIYVAAREGFEALSTLLGKDNYFFGGETPSLLDASVFAYTHLLLDEDLGNGWQETRLCRVVQDHPNLVRHRKRIYKGWYM